MSDPEETLDQFAKKAWKIFNEGDWRWALRHRLELTGGREVNTIYMAPIASRYFPIREAILLYKILERSPQISNNFTLEDVSRFFDNFLVSEYSGGAPKSRLTFEGFKEIISRSIFCPPSTYNFYFHLGIGAKFIEGYQLGTGKLYTAQKLQDKLPPDGKIKYKSKHWFMHLQVRSIGSKMAELKAIQAFQRNMNIYKFVTSQQRYWQDDSEATSIEVGDRFTEYRMRSGYPMRYFYGKDKAEDTVIYAVSSSLSVKRYTSLENIFVKINRIANKIDLNDLDERILNAIDIFGLIDYSMPIHVRFILCIFALEGLLLGKDDRDYLGWKLAEKVSFILGSSKQWLKGYLEYRNDMEAVGLQSLAESRLLISKVVRRLYGKRSGFAHGGSAIDANLVWRDFKLASITLWTVINELIDLSQNDRITHISRRMTKNRGSGLLQDEASLDVYIDKIKYGSKVF